jgi:hypothetical protein
MNDDKHAKDYNIEGGSVLHLVGGCARARSLRVLCRLQRIAPLARARAGGVPGLCCGSGVQCGWTNRLIAPCPHLV